MKHSPQELEKLIHQTLRALPDRAAPRSLEARVLAAIEARAAAPWWKQPYPRWPIVVRCVFLIVSGGIVKAAIMGMVWVMGDFNGAEFVNIFATPLAWFDRIQSIVAGIGNLGEVILRSMPSLWLYGGLAGLAWLYAVLFGLGATAYRALYTGR